LSPLCLRIRHIKLCLWMTHPSLPKHGKLKKTASQTSDRKAGCGQKENEKTAKTEHHCHFEIGINDSAVNSLLLPDSAKKRK
jgi:hypothetical protein